MTMIALCVVSCLLVGFSVLFCLCSWDWKKERDRADAAEEKLFHETERVNDQRKVAMKIIDDKCNQQKEYESAMIGINGQLQEQKALVDSLNTEVLLLQSELDWRRKDMNAIDRLTQDWPKTIVTAGV